MQAPSSHGSVGLLFVVRMLLPVPSIGKEPNVRLSLLVVSVCAVACGGASGGVVPADAPAADPTAGPAATTGPSAGAGGGGGGGVATTASSCDPTAPFGAPVPVVGVNTGGYEGDATLSADELEIYFDVFSSDVFSELRVARRATKTDPFGAASPVGIGGTTAYSPMLSSDDVTLFYADGSGTPELRRAERPSRRAAFGSPTAVDGIGVHPDGAYLSNDRTTLWMIVRDANGKLDIYQSTASPAGVFGAAVNVKELNTPATETGPVPTADGLVLYFGSSRDDPAATHLDVWMATRPTKDAPFGTPTKLDALNTAEDDWPTWLSPDGCRLYLSTNRSGSYDVYVAQRTR